VVGYASGDGSSLSHGLLHAEALYDILNQQELNPRPKHFQKSQKSNHKRDSRNPLTRLLEDLFSLTMPLDFRMKKIKLVAEVKHTMS